MNQRHAIEASRPARKRLLATGRKINGTWNVTTFLRAVAGGSGTTFWESTETAVPRRRGAKSAH
jgi:hypothetical protein